MYPSTITIESIDAALPMLISALRRVTQGHAVGICASTITAHVSKSTHHSTIATVSLPFGRVVIASPVIERNAEAASRIEVVDHALATK